MKEKHKLFEWCVLYVKANGNGDIIFCATDWMADRILDDFDGMLAVKYPSKRLR